MNRFSKGFTVIELIVVVTIISILVAIAYVAYNGAQNRAKDAQTISAAEQWMKALQIYKVRNGGFPANASCLGANYKFNSDNAGASGIGQCRQDNVSTGTLTNTTFYTAMGPYITGNPTPAMNSAVNSATNWYRGLYYIVAAGNIGRIEFVVTPSSGGCPSQVGGVSRLSSTAATNGNLLCTYALGSSVSY